jgi:hypothetical protein
MLVEMMGVMYIQPPPAIEAVIVIIKQIAVVVAVIKQSITVMAVGMNEKVAVVLAMITGTELS